MARLALVAFCVTAAIAGARADNLSFGMSMATKAFDAVCWYESLKIFPETQSKVFGKCNGGSAHLNEMVDNPSPKNKKYFEVYPDKRTTKYGETFVSQSIFGKLPDNGKEYKSNCEKYLKDLDGVNGKAPADEGDALNDGGNEYPYRAFAYCMMKTLRDKRGNGAIEAVKKERTHGRVHWRDTLLTRENEFRARHGVPPLQRIKDLNDAAQQWAETNAKMCKMEHSKNSDAGRQYGGGSTGESLSVGGGKDDPENQAYLAADGWYEEIKDYPYPEGYQGNDNNLFHKIGHFTQSVWKGTQQVGYGYAYNPNCGTYQRYIAARYWPPGNMDGDYPDNVTPPKK